MQLLTTNEKAYLDEVFSRGDNGIFRDAFKKVERSIGRSYFLKKELPNLSSCYQELANFKFGKQQIDATSLRAKVAVIKMLSRVCESQLSIGELTQFAYIDALASIYASLAKGPRKRLKEGNIWKFTAAASLFMLILYDEFLTIYENKNFEDNDMVGF